MSRIIALLVLSTLSLFTLLPNTGVTTSLLAAPPAEMTVEIQFSGLMVFHFNNVTKSYEVGVLSENDSHHHEFCIQRAGAPHPLCRADLPKGKRWTLSVTREPGASLMKEGHKGRRPDSAKGQFDFDWIVDLEGEDFHNKPLELEPGHLVPIIQLPKARLFTRYKSEDFLRWKGKRPDTPEAFGFVSETTAMTLKLRPGEKVVLSEDGTGEEIFNIPYAPRSRVGSSDEVITIANIRPFNKEDKSSDFGMYYKIFKNFQDEQFDFDLNTDNLRPRAKNPLPGYRTCCHLRCTSVFLSKWDKPLE